MSVSVLVLDGVFDTGLTTVVDTLTLANELSQTVHEGEAFDVNLVSVRRRVRTALGLSVPSLRLDEIEWPETLVVPALGAKTPQSLAEALGRADVRDAIEVLREAQDNGVRLAAACTGTYLLAATGLLDGKLATTTWWLAADFRTRFPEVNLDESKMVVDEGQHVTAGAALAHVDLALWIVRQRSPALADLVGRYLLVDDRPSQTSYAMLDHLSQVDPVVAQFERWARAHLAEFTLADAARAVGTTERTLQRRIRKAMGRTPIAYVRDLRVELAIHQLRTTDKTVDEIAEAVGYQDPVTLRTLLRSKTGRGIRELRRGG